MSKFVSAIAVLAVACPAVGEAQAPSLRLRFDIGASDTATALNLYAREARVHLVFPYDAVAGRRFAGLHGSFTREEALHRLIAGQGLVIASRSATMISLQSAPLDARPAAVAVNAQEAEPPLADIVVLGEGQSREVETVSKRALKTLTPGSSPLRALGRLPGVNFDASDAHGTYEASTQLSIRGFLSDQMGYTLDGVPLGNFQYRNNNGLSINRALLAENNGPASLSQGSGALGTASTSNIGGTVDFTSIAPSHQFGIDLEQSYGSEDSWRTFVRVNSGDLPWGGRLMAAYAHDREGKWRGWGQQAQDQINLKYVQPIGTGVTSTTFLDLIDRREDDYNDVSLNSLKTYGYFFDNIKDYALAQRLATLTQNGGTPPAPFVNPDDTIYQGGGVRQDLLAYEKLDYGAGSRLSGFTTGYLHLDHGIGTYASPYDSTPAAYGGASIAVSALRYDIDRKGIISRLHFEAGAHRLEGGVWYEHNAFNQGKYLYGLQAATPPREFEQFYTNPFSTTFYNQYRTDTIQVDLGDTWQATSRLRLNAGVKGVSSTNTANSIISTKPINGSIKAQNWFLPTAGVLYTLDAHGELFGNYTRNMAAFVASTSSGPFSSSSQAGFNYIRGDLKPETTDTFEAGYRFHDRQLQLSLTGYYVKFTNRLLASSISAVVVGNQNVLQNVGGVSSRGVETAATWRVAGPVSLYGSYAYNDAHYDDDVQPLGGAVVPIKGKQVVASPRHIATAEVNYDDGSLWGGISAHYRTRRYYTYLNDAVLPGAVNVNLSIGYRFGRRFDVQLNVTNLFDKRYVASTGTAGFVTSDPNGTYTTLQTAAPRQAFGTVGVHF